MFLFSQKRHSITSSSSFKCTGRCQRKISTGTHPYQNNLRQSALKQDGKLFSKLHFLYFTANCPVPQDSWQPFVGNVTGQNVWPSFITLHYVTVFSIHNLLYREIRAKSGTQNYTVLRIICPKLLDAPVSNWFLCIVNTCDLGGRRGEKSRHWYLSNLTLTDLFKF